LKEGPSDLFAPTEPSNKVVSRTRGVFIGQAIASAADATEYGPNLPDSLLERQSNNSPNYSSPHGLTPGRLYNLKRLFHNSLPGFLDK
jgi:hypothetical protein